MFFWTPLPMKILVLRKKGYAALISRNSRRAQNPLHPSEGAFPYRNTQHHDVCVCVCVVIKCLSLQTWPSRSTRGPHPTAREAPANPRPFIYSQLFI